MDGEKIKKLKRGELIGNIATYACCAATLYFIICFTLGTTLDIGGLRLSTLIVAPILIVAAAAVAAYCNLKFGNALDKEIRGFVQQTFIENAALMHPERGSLTFYILIDSRSAEVRVNGYKEKIEFDFSVLGKMGYSRKSAVCSAITDRLCASFCKLWERGAKYSEVSYAVTPDPKKQQRKTVYIIQNGEIEKKAYKQYKKLSA